MNVIQTTGLSKAYGKTTAVDNVSIHVREGEIYGFLGLNGAGKTTLIRLLLGLIKPDKGSILLFNQKINRASEQWNKVGYMVETPYSYPNLSVQENLEVYLRLRGLREKNRIKQVIEVLKLGQYKTVKAKHLSMGNNQRLGLAKALLHEPKLLILDEPINGLDPAGIVEIREFLKELVQQKGSTIFLSSHILSEISRLATLIGIVHQGKLIKEINTSDLDSQIIKKILVNTSKNQSAIKLLSANGIAAVLSTAGLVEIQDEQVISQPEKIASQIVNSGISLKMLSVYEEDLEKYFLRMIGNK